MDQAVWFNMSTFNGIIHEFTDIRVDFFRGFGLQPPLACFLSHVHTDHLAGLDRLRSPFVYCSAATREILLRLERYPCRLNYARGIFEDPRMQTYKHLAKVLKPIPLDTPTELELKPGVRIQVTLLDANHCPGAVMFLIEGDGKAILYTGDMRSEPWFVSSVARSPAMIEYSTGLKTLDRIYLDTSILDDFPLQTKAEGLSELLGKVSRYPKDTIFHIKAWTYGYEDVWVALSKALGSKIHVDKYKMGIYKSLVTKSTDNRFAAQTHLTKDAPYLVGFTCGNIQREGCLTLDEDVRIHSCEKGMGCHVTEVKPIVWIQPIVAHLENARDMVEVGIGGGGDDLAQKLTLDPEDISKLIDIVRDKNELVAQPGNEIKDILENALIGFREVVLDLDAPEFTKEESFKEIIASLVKKAKAICNPIRSLGDQGEHHNALPNHIVFPYARHSSLPELRHFVETFRPKDIWPCTVNPRSWNKRGITMRGLFGDCCSGDSFEHDALMERWSSLGRSSREREGKPGADFDTQSTSAHPDASSQPTPPADSPAVDEPNDGSCTPADDGPLAEDVSCPGPALTPETTRSPPPPPSKRDHDAFLLDSQGAETDSYSDADLQDSQASALSAHAYETRLHAFLTARANVEGGGAWGTINLISTTDNHSVIEPELGGP
ncbi:Metallo-hydrolase/oxidoreductase [Durotheca rogersii]|uniref:Metallo-hydrolase/oxidoreductase n=1 Tax=Durotheca rogersii TaxID=419775 RepID=UPI0022211B5E|nr:Metallo-hydrolase/oxidoreductase [Durotheca rogersii]KAI5866068.1 Metallo-hydrolase/oxidoreductase [Durotheca rogersii]